MPLSSSEQKNSPIETCKLNVSVDVDPEQLEWNPDFEPGRDELTALQWTLLIGNRDFRLGGTSQVGVG